ncbi:HEPN domain-containing protein [Rhodococcus pyridinivorans]|uniref:HEPN domain-containing protein n=1 Tax=Rhodococcus pyridinivorans TaxID=103816 RepID=UPI0026596606|nr:HEPN domain-containing protein [Rhodococcus pyridinivorans]
MSASGEVMLGWFWRVGMPLPERRGELRVSAGKEAELRVERPISPSRSLRVEQRGSNGMYAVTTSGDPDDVVADFQPVTVHGVLDDGTEVTVVDAQADHDVLLRQWFRAPVVVMGAHLGGQEQCYAAVRFCLDDPRWWTHLIEPARGSGCGEVGSLRVYADDDGQVWFEHRAHGPLTRREYARLVVDPVLTLAKLATQSRLQVTALEFRVADERNVEDTRWLPVIGRIIDSGTAGSYPDAVVPTRELTLEVFSTWIDVSRGLDGLASAVADPIDGAIQAQALTMCAIAEGLHRRLYPVTSRFPGLSGNARDRVRRAARTAGAEMLEQKGFDREESEKVLNEALSHFDELSYRRRLEQLQESAECAVPEIVADFSDWPAQVCSARNQLAHQAYTSDAMSDGLLLLLIAVDYSLSWVLRTVLLRRAGIPDEVVLRCYENDARYGLYRANVRSCLNSGEGPRT